MKKYLTPAAAVIAIAAYLLGTAYGRRTPVVNQIASKLPRASL